MGAVPSGSSGWHHHVPSHGMLSDKGYSLAIYHDAAIMVSHKSWSRAGSSMSLPPLWYSRSIATKSILLHNRTDL
jgi:hypothetical protein